jgi:DNA-binding IclR family transcriptional regulator
MQRNRDALQLYGKMTTERMMELVAETRERGWASLGNTAVPGALGVGMAWREPDGRARLGVSVASAVDRMPWHRQVWIAELLHSELLGNAAARATTRSKRFR